MDINTEILFELLYESYPDYKVLSYKKLNILTENNGIINFVFSGYDFRIKRNINHKFYFSIIHYNNKLRNKKLNSL
jgi:hypothetical protein